MPNGNHPCCSYCYCCEGGNQLPIIPLEEDDAFMFVRQMIQEEVTVGALHVSLTPTDTQTLLYSLSLFAIAHIHRMY